MIYTDDMRPLLLEGQATIRRVSHVEPNAHGWWQADLAPVKGPVLGPFQFRQQALDAEIVWLEEYAL